MYRVQCCDLKHCGDYRAQKVVVVWYRTGAFIMLPYICQTAAYITFGMVGRGETSGENSTAPSQEIRSSFTAAITTDQDNSLTVHDL